MDREHKLKSYFNSVIHGKRNLPTAREGRLFIEAICAQTDAPACSYDLLRSNAGPTALQAAVRFDTSSTFLNEHAVQLLDYFQNPSIQAISSGLVLQQLIELIAQPPFFLDAYTQACHDCTLTTEATRNYAWLCLQLVCSSNRANACRTDLERTVELFLKSKDGATRNLGQKIKHNLQSNAPPPENGPGGRHDNDHSDYRDILIFPTADELLSKDKPFYRTAQYLNDEDDMKETTHLDNQFRILREDMLGEIREELEVFCGKKTGRHRGLIIDHLQMVDICTGDDRSRMPWGIRFGCQEPLQFLRNIASNKQKDYLTDNKHLLRHGNMCCLVVNNEPVSFPTIHRDVDALIQDRAKITLQFRDDHSLRRTLSLIKKAHNIKMVELDSATFAYEPFLDRLQKMRGLPLADELLHLECQKQPTFLPDRIIKSLEAHTGKDIRNLLQLDKKVILDESQMSSLTSCLRQRVSLVQGPPGALTAKVLFDNTQETILVICFTNHAVDQFLEDLMDIGIPSTAMVRLGSKSTSKTATLKLRNQPQGGFTPSQGKQIDTLRQRLSDHEIRLQNAVNNYIGANIQKQNLMDYLEFLDDDVSFFESFLVPENNGMKVVGRKGKAINHHYLLDRWIRGQDAGLFKRSSDPSVWNIPNQIRQELLERWQTAILEDLVSEVMASGRLFNNEESSLKALFNMRDTNVIRHKRIIACTTNGAARYFSAIESARPSIVLVEEAGEILEAHILTALMPQTQQLIMIGDHKQLRPKCSYPLSVEQGDGFDLNRSLFERLLLKEYPYNTLTKQHRMRPEISSMIRLLTYPHLEDAASTQSRADVRGLRNNVIFMTHSHPEVELTKNHERREKTTSKQNVFEGHMVLKCIKYLAQQGYSSDRMVVLTPYLGQLRLLRDILAELHDPVLNDLDKFDLIQAGLLADLGPSSKKPKLSISTIDNYQGEESDIVLVSMTRSNKSHDIGFMAAPERLNVLLSRARDGLIMFGDMDTFTNARNGKDLWRKFMNHLKENRQLYDGLPVRCERHTDRIALLQSPDDFDTFCPDGGCQERCHVLLLCKKHLCPSRCHQLYDHSRIKCMEIMDDKCVAGHPRMWECHKGVPSTCGKCDRIKRDAERKAQQALREQEARELKEKKHAEELAKLEIELNQLMQDMKIARLDKDRAAVIEQKRQDIANMKSKRLILRQPTLATPSVSLSEEQPVRDIAHPQSVTSPTIPRDNTASQIEWQRQKDHENADNSAIDSIMKMIGLEDVKRQVLRIKDKVSTCNRQGTDIMKERFGITLLGNPGTGKTTVARHYAKALSSLGVLPGDTFIETTGSKLAHDGVSEVKKHLENLKDGGVYFIDEAYQLTEGHNFGGRPVLDYLLAEIENLTGTVVFVFAGYRKQMEKFFEHNPGLISRIPYSLRFEDYTDIELLRILQYQMCQFFQHGVRVEDGENGLYMRIAVRQLGRGRGRDGFGNARAVENLFSKIRERQSERLSAARRVGVSADDLYFSKEDLIGPDPSKAILCCQAWTELRELTGLDEVKKSISVLIDNINVNYQRELVEKEPIKVSLNRVFLGSPGTGKTTVATLYGQILVDLGMLSNGEVIIKNPADFIGSHLGQSEANTKAILCTTIGKVLVIDEAYMLYSNGASDPYKTAVIDTIVAEVQSLPGDDRCVLLLGYEEEMKTMFQNVNPGLTRRFDLENAFYFEDFTHPELQEILVYKLKKQDLTATTEAIQVALAVLDRKKNTLNFGNGGDVENLISSAKMNYQTRQIGLPAEQRTLDCEFQPEDFDPNYNRLSNSDTNLRELFAGVVGCETIITKLEGFARMAKKAKANGRDARKLIPMNFIFKGPPGTGKTTTARKFGQFYYELGFLSKAEVIECSATDLVGEFVGHTGPKTKKTLEQGLGKVLFIDEAYRLGQGHFAQEAIDEIVDCVTKPKFYGKMVIILGGYEKDMNTLLSTNEGLSSRFEHQIIFPSLLPDQCLKVLEAILKKEDILFDLHDVRKQLEKSFAELLTLPSWGNARDIQTLGKSMIGAAYQDETPGPPSLSNNAALKCTNDMLLERAGRTKILKEGPRDMALAQVNYKQDTQNILKPRIEVTTQKQEEPRSMIGNVRDDGVSESIWQQLEQDKRNAELSIRETRDSIAIQEDDILAMQQAVKDAEDATRQYQKLEAYTSDDTEQRKLMKLREEARLREIELRVEQERKIQEIEKAKQAEMEERKKDQLVQRKLREMGVCCAGYRWIKQSSGYRCAGGSHFVSDAQIGVL